LTTNVVVRAGGVDHTRPVINTKPEIDVQLARRLVDSQFPKWAPFAAT